MNTTPFPMPRNCPWCKAKLEGEILLVFRHGNEFSNLYETKRIGGSNYTFVHNPKGCFVPSLDRLLTPNDITRAKENAPAH